MPAYSVIFHFTKKKKIARPDYSTMRYLALSSCLILCINVLSIRADPVEECVPRNGSYSVADSKQCDKFHECQKSGKFQEKLCRDGYDYNPDYGQCDFPFKVNCEARTERQPPQSTNPLCHRLYGLYAFDPKESCAKFYHCQEGIAHEKECPKGIIYDPSSGTCVHPDTAQRKDCSASEVHKFQCPNFGKKFTKLRFFDHDRLSHPEDCRQYFTCDAHAQPRIYGCPHEKVFLEKSGRCIKATKHPDPKCRDYYKLGGLGYDSRPEDEDDESGEVTSEEIQEVSKKIKTKSKREADEFPFPPITPIIKSRENLGVTNLGPDNKPARPAPAVVAASRPAVSSARKPTGNRKQSEKKLRQVEEDSDSDLEP